MRKILLSVLALSASLSSTQAAPFKGLYVGAGAGYTKAKFDSSVKIGRLKIEKDKSASGLILDTFLGYGHAWSSGIYLGGELGLGYETERMNIKYNNNARLSLKPGMVVSISGRFGFVINNSTLLYTRFGFQGHQSSVEAKAFGNTKKFRRGGILLGLGGEHYLNNNVFIRGEYKYNTGSIYTYKFNNVKFRFRTPTHTFLLGVGYKF
jgi:opacity protein-like surface antigen